jgi:hypothetical protein
MVFGSTKSSTLTMLFIALTMSGADVGVSCTAAAAAFDFEASRRLSNRDLSDLTEIKYK